MSESQIVAELLRIGQLLLTGQLDKFSAAAEIAALHSAMLAVDAAVDAAEDAKVDG